MKTSVKIWMICAWFALSTVVQAASFLGINFNDPDQMLKDLNEAQADEWSWVGSTMVFKGNIRIPYRDLVFYADNAVIDVENRDLELSGNIQVYRVIKSKQTMTIDQLDRVMGMAQSTFTIDGYSTDVLENQKISVSLCTPGEAITARQVAGNLNTGWFSFEDLTCDYGSFVGSARSGERRPSGEIELHQAEVSTCCYLAEHEAHYSVYCDSATITPHEAGYNGLKGYNSDMGEHSILGKNCQIRVYGVPVMWLPIFYKPKDESLGLFQLVGGESSDYGYYLSVSRKFNISDYPYAWVRPRVDWFELRGVGYGATGGVASDQSRTNFFAYSIYDLRPYQSSEVSDYRLEIPNARYHFELDNVTHVTPRLDFRGQFNLSSDYYFNRDYQANLFDSDPEPASYAALEYQFDRSSVGMIVRPQVNSFYATAQQLPSLIYDLPRQELFGTNLYYQGRVRLEYLSMRWREFDKPRYRYPGTPQQIEVPGPENYQTGRADSVNFLYYPFKLFDFLNIVPRAGLRLTAYSNSSDTAVDEEAIARLQQADAPTSMTSDTLTNYDDKGGSRFRVAEELGVEMSMKIYHAWQNVRSPFLNLDGLRHVIEPYTNYTFIPEPNVNNDYLYYFDDIDRIQETNFVRLGVKNRLQTRTGTAMNPQLHNWLSMENYWDLFFKKEGDKNGIGDLGTEITFAPGNGFSLTASCSFDLGNNYERQDVMRNGRNVGRPGLDWSNLNYLSLAAEYALLEDLVFSLSYEMQDAYQSRSIYSMGSTLLNPQASSSWSRYIDQQSQEVIFGVRFPITRDRDLRGAYSITYDFYQGAITEQSLQLVKTLHCWDVVFEIAQDRNWDSNNAEYNREYAFRLTAYLNGLISPLQQVQRQMQTTGQKLQGGEGSGGGMGGFSFL